MTYFRPHHHKRNVIGVRVMSSMITGYNGTDVPPYSRFYLGGENDVRGFDFYTISPFVAIPSSSTTTVTYFDPTRLGPGGAPTQVALNVPIVTFLPTRPGGDFQGVGNFEYRIPIAGPVSMSLFNDIGLDGIIRKSQLGLNPGALSTLQQQYPNADFPNLTIPRNLEVLSGTNFKPHTSAGVEFVIQLPIVNAPFRFYYAYNYLRLNQTISGPRGGFFLSDAQKSALPPGVFETQIAPQLDTILDSQVQRIPAGLIEPKQTFRFTISRTF
jgi:outer membrane protein insertion porin family